MKVFEGERLSWGYGIAWRNYESRSYEAYLIPLNIIARKLRDMYWWFASAAHEKKQLDKTYHAGYDSGYEAGKNYGERSGYNKGYEQGKKDTDEEFGRAIRKSFTAPHYKIKE